MCNELKQGTKTVIIYVATGFSWLYRVVKKLEVLGAYWNIKYLQVISNLHAYLRDIYSLINKHIFVINSAGGFKFV
jgi:hypothetical protein